MRNSTFATFRPNFANISHSRSFKTDDFETLARIMVRLYCIPVMCMYTILVRRFRPTHAGALDGLDRPGIRSDIGRVHQTKTGTWVATAYLKVLNVVSCAHVPKVGRVVTSLSRTYFIFLNR